MGRRSSRPSGGRRATPPRAASRAPARSASSSSRTAPPPARRPASSTSGTQKKSTNSPSTPQPSQGSAAGGFMSNMASTGLGVMAGRAMDRAFFGGSNSADIPNEAGAASNEVYDQSAIEDQIPETVCAREALEFQKCMDRTSANVASCQWNLDILAACQRQQQEMGFADSGRL